MKIAIVVNLTKQKAINCAKEAAIIFLGNNAEVYMLSECAPFYKGIQIEYADTINQLFDICDIAVTVGGDGTIIHAAKYAATADVPLIGINVGRLCRTHYRGTLNDGTVFDSSYERGEPLEFICGVGMMIRGYDEAVANMEVGQSIDIHLTPDQAYGYADPRAIFTIEISQLPGSEELSVGENVTLYTADGRPIPVKVTARDDSTITFDANHEMAGKELNFHIELVEVQ